MNTPDRVFHALWHERLDGTPSEQYVPGNNLRVDAAVRTLLPGKRLLDIGCGSGTLGVAVRNKFEEVYGIDIAEDAVATARGNGQTAQRIDLNSESLPFPAEFFDAVTVLAVLPYVYDPYYVLRECHRVLVPGGRLVLSAANMRTVGKPQTRLRVRKVQLPPYYTGELSDGGISGVCVRRGGNRVVVLAIQLFTLPVKLGRFIVLTENALTS